MKAPLIASTGNPFKIITQPLPTQMFNTCCRIYVRRENSFQNKEFLYLCLFALSAVLQGRNPLTPAGLGSGAYGSLGVYFLPETKGFLVEKPVEKLTNI